MNVRGPALKFKERVLAKMAAPSGARDMAANWSLSLKYSVRNVKPNFFAGIHVQVNGRTPPVLHLHLSLIFTWLSFVL